MHSVMGCILSWMCYMGFAYLTRHGRRKTVRDLEKYHHFVHNFRMKTHCDAKSSACECRNWLDSQFFVTYDQEDGK